MGRSTFYGTPLLSLIKIVLLVTSLLNHDAGADDGDDLYLRPAVDEASLGDDVDSLFAELGPPCGM